MNKKKLYEYCDSNTNTRRYFEKDIAEPLWKIVTEMIRTNKEIQAFELNVNSLALYLFAELNGKCRQAVSMSEADSVIVDYFFPALEKTFRERIRKIKGSSAEDIAICCREREAVMLYGDSRLVSSARNDFIEKGLRAFA